MIYGKHYLTEKLSLRQRVVFYEYMINDTKGKFLPDTDGNAHIFTEQNMMISSKLLHLISKKPISTLDLSKELNMDINTLHDIVVRNCLNHPQPFLKQLCTFFDFPYIQLLEGTTDIKAINKHKLKCKKIILKKIKLSR